MLKKFLFITSSGLLKLSLLGLALAGAGWLTFGTPDNIKKAADESNIYSGLVNGMLESAVQDAQNNTEQQLPITDPKIQQIAKDSFPPETLSKQGDAIINGIYSWLQGKTEAPQFSIDLTEAKQRFANGIADYAVERYEALPPCTLTQMRSMDLNTIDPFTATCRPPQVPSSLVRERVYNEVINSDTFLQETSFTANDLPKDGQGRTIFDTLAAAPAVYSALRLLPWILAAASIVLAGLVYLLHDNKKRAFRSLGITFLGTGIFLAIGALLLTWSFNLMNPANDALTFQTSLVEMAKALVNDYNAALTRFYVSYLGIGAVILVSLWYLNRSEGRQAPQKTV